MGDKVCAGCVILTDSVRVFITSDFFWNLWNVIRRRRLQSLSRFDRKVQSKVALKKPKARVCSTIWPFRKLPSHPIKLVISALCEGSIKWACHVLLARQDAEESYLWLATLFWIVNKRGFVFLKSSKGVGDARIVEIGLFIEATGA